MMETKIDAVVGVGICGNNLIEGSEDCEGVDLGGATCRNIGFESGDLSCDISCRFDISMCVGEQVIQPRLFFAPGSGSMPPPVGAGGGSPAIISNPISSYYFSDPATVEFGQIRNNSEVEEYVSFTSVLDEHIVLPEVKEDNLFFSVDMEIGQGFFFVFPLIIFFILFFFWIFWKRRKDKEEDKKYYL